VDTSKKTICGLTTRADGKPAQEECCLKKNREEREKPKKKAGGIRGGDPHQKMYTTQSKENGDHRGWDEPLKTGSEKGKKLGRKTLGELLRPSLLTAASTTEVRNGDGYDEESRSKGGVL